MHRIAFAGIAIAILTAGTIAGDAQSMPQRVRGTIGQVTADAITIHTDDGKDQTLPLAPDVRIASDRALTLADIKSGDYIGTGATKQPDGTLVADEVTVFPAAARGVGEGQHPWTGGPNSSMTNANVDDVAMGTSGNVLKLSYKGGTADVVVKPGTPIVTIIDFGDTWVRAEAPETEARFISAGDKLKVRLPGGNPIEGTVIFKAVESDYATQRDVSRRKRDIKTIGLKLKVDNPDGALVPGMTAEVLLPQQLTKGAR